MKVEQAISLYQEYHRMNSKKTLSTPTGARCPSSVMSSATGGASSFIHFLWEVRVSALESEKA